MKLKLHCTEIDILSSLQSKLEEGMDLAIEQGRLDEAVAMNEKLTQREFASKVATAFDCHDYVQRKTVWSSTFIAENTVCFTKSK